MKFSKLKITPTALLVALLPILLGILATLQYRWLGEISLAERERMQTRLQTDVKRFAQDFNAEVTKVFFAFQLNSVDAENSEKLADRFEIWRKQTQFPSLISEIYVAKNSGNGEPQLSLYNISEKRFSPASWKEDLKPLLAKINDRKKTDAPGFISAFDSVAPEVPALLIPSGEAQNQIVPPPSRVDLRAAFSQVNTFLIVRLDSAVIKNEIVPELSRRYFSDSNFAFAIFNNVSEAKTIYQSNENFDFSKADASTALFDISPESANILLLNTELPRFRTPEVGRAIVFQSKTEQTDKKPKEITGSPTNRNFQVQVLRTTRETQNTIINRSDEARGDWLLKVSHADGSLESFVNKTRWRNLGISFGILALLGASVVLLVLSTHRATRHARRQIDFVSSVTHEFRTPLAVICSAGDNLADGIVNQPAQIEKYGKLIRREGNRLSEMVEQILEFAGARSRRKKYDFQPISISALIETVLADCQPLIEEKKFTIEKQIAANLPEVSADRSALKQSLQNLINNALKYGNGWIGVSAQEEAGNVTISVEDKGFGIEKSELRQIFEPFYRGSRAVSEQIHGNGLGLSLVKQIVEAHGGEIYVESEPGKGSRFTIRIPAALPNLEPQRHRDREILKSETI